MTKIIALLGLLTVVTFVAVYGGLNGTGNGVLFLALLAAFATTDRTFWSKHAR